MKNEHFEVVKILVQVEALVNFGTIRKWLTTFVKNKTKTYA